MASDDDSRTADTPRLLLDRYRIDGLLGEGGLGTVVRAFDTRLKRTVAIKTLKRNAYSTDPDQFRAVEERFAREAEAGARMGMHANLVAVHDLIVEEDRTQYLVLEFVPGGTLRDGIGAGPLTLGDALHLAIDIAQGLHAAHEMGLVHRDIKPANIFLTNEGRAKVGDFGIAQIDDISGRTHTTSSHPGTPLYMSPEQERHSAYLRPASDQFSLGLVLFEMLTGQIYKRVGARQAAALLAQQPAPVSALVTRMISEDPDDRYPSMADVVRAMQTIERQFAGAETQLPTRLGSGVPLHRDEALITTRQETPRVRLSPVPPVAVYGAPPALPGERRYSRRAILIGGAGAVIAAGAAGVAIAGVRSGGSAIATATVGATVVAAAPTALPTATSSPPATATAPPAAPIIVTAPPIIITATPMPTPIVITATPSPATPTPLAPPTALPTATSLPPTAVAPPAVRQSQLATWRDPQGRFQLGYPSAWRLTQNPAPSVIEFDGFQIGFEVTAYKDATTSPEQQIDYLHNHRKPGRQYVDGPTEPTNVGGEQGASMQYKSLGLGGTTDVHEGKFWIVTHAGTSFEFEGFTLVPFTSETYAILNAIVASVTFLR